MLHPEYLPTYLLEKPERMINFGKAVCTVTAFFMVLAAYGKILLIANSLQFLMSKTIPPASLGELYPEWPTWFVAESLGSYILIAIMMMIGLYTVYYGRYVKRLMDSF